MLMICERIHSYVYAHMYRMAFDSKLYVYVMKIAYYKFLIASSCIAFHRYHLEKSLFQ